ncbi:MAG TPA: cellulase family glycosylhydrolase [Pilimelia sp.]|nr:cellulase family glycosylhydrolase [Pilimelia sp.]
MFRRMLGLAALAALLATVAVSPPAHAAPLVGGVAGGGAQPWNDRRPADYAAMRAAGATWLRGDIAWEYLQPTNDPYRWDLYDPAVADARAAGLEYLAILHMVPAWANGGRGNYAPPSNMALLTDYCYQVVKRYLPRGVRHYEIGNEVNLPHPGWNLSGRYYVSRLLSPCVSGVRRASAELRLPVTIFLGALAPHECCAGTPPTTYLTDVYAAGGAGLFDLLSWHPYTTDPRTHPNMNSVPDQLNDITVRRTGSSRQIWATEYGAPTAGEFSVDEAWQARLVGEAYSAWSRHPYAGPLLWYAIRDEGAPPSTEREHFFGLLRNNGDPKPAYAEFSRVLGGSGSPG